MSQCNLSASQKKLMRYANQNGSSTIEFIVTLIVFIPLFIGIPLLGKYADIKHKTIEASRYIAFERTVYSEPGASTRNDSWTDSNGQLHQEAYKPNAEIIAEAELRMFGHPSQGLHNTEPTENPMWVNRRGESLLARNATTDEDPNNNNSNSSETNRYLTGTMGQSKVTDHISGPAQFPAVYTQGMATGGGEFGGIFGGGSGVQEIGDASEQGSTDIGGLMDGSGFLSNDGCGIPGLNLSGGIGLGTRNYAEINVSTPIVNFLNVRDEVQPLAFRAQAAVLSNSWTVPSEPKFQRRLDNQVPNQFLSCITFPAEIFALLSAPWKQEPGFLFGEGALAYPAKIDETPSMRLPNELKYYDEDR